MAFQNKRKFLRKQFIDRKNSKAIKLNLSEY